MMLTHQHQPSVSYRPLTTDEAIEIVNGLLARPSVDLAALAIEHGATLCTTDRDTRFTGVRLSNPLDD